MRRVNQDGFTVPELVVVCSVLLVVIVIASFFMHARDYSPVNRNAERHVAIARLMTAIRNYTAENGSLPPSVEVRKRLIGAKNNHELCGELVPRYLKAVPSDPLLQQDDIRDCGNTDYDTALAVSRSVDGKQVTVEAPLAEGGATIRLTYQL